MRLDIKQLKNAFIVSKIITWASEGVWGRSESPQKKKHLFIAIE